jgi:hypothetical protein
MESFALLGDSEALERPRTAGTLQGHDSSSERSGARCALSTTVEVPRSFVPHSAKLRVAL